MCVLLLLLILFIIILFSIWANILKYKLLTFFHSDQAYNSEQIFELRRVPMIPPLACLGFTTQASRDGFHQDHAESLLTQQEGYYQ